MRWYIVKQERNRTVVRNWFINKYSKWNVTRFILFQFCVSLKKTKKNERKKKKSKFPKVCIHSERPFRRLVKRSARIRIERRWSFSIINYLVIMYLFFFRIKCRTWFSYCFTMLKFLQVCWVLSLAVCEIM